MLAEAIPVVVVMHIQVRHGRDMHDHMDWKVITYTKKDNTEALQDLSKMISN